MTDSRPCTIPGGYSIEELRAHRTCTTLFGGLPCFRPAGGIIMLMCVHEHMHYASACSRCLQVAREHLAKQEMACHRCRDCSQPHFCPMAEVEWEAW